jgi:hypothetical protein
LRVNPAREGAHHGCSTIPSAQPHTPATPSSHQSSTQVAHILRTTVPSARFFALLRCTSKLPAGLAARYDCCVHAVSDVFAADRVIYWKNYMA